MTSTEKIIQFINDWKPSQSALARRMGLGEKCFNNKLRERGAFKLSLTEKNKLTLIFREMNKELSEILEQQTDIVEQKKVNPPKRTVFITTKLKPVI